MSALIFDISVELNSDFPAWPGDPSVEVESFSARDKGDPSNASRLTCSVHSGTHVDAPRHLFADGPGVDGLSLEVMIGEAYVADLKGMSQITPAQLDALPLPPGTQRLLLHTDNSMLWRQAHHSFHEDFVALVPEAADWIVERGIKLVGIDYHSIQRFSDTTSYTHERLLNSGVVILETLNLNGVAAGSYTLICMPLKLTDADGAPARAVLLTNSIG